MGINLVTLWEQIKWIFSLLRFGEHQFLKASWLWVGLRVHFPFPVLGFCQVWTCAGLCVCCPGPWAHHVCISPVVSRGCCLFDVIDRPWLFQSFCLLFHVIPEPGREGFEKPTGSLPEMETIPDAAKVAKNLRWDRLWALEDLTTLTLLKEYSNEWLWMTSRVAGN